MTSLRTTRQGVDRYEPTEIEPRWQKRWDEIGLYKTDLDAPQQAQVLRADDVRLPVGRPAHRPLVRQNAYRRDRALPPDEGPKRASFRSASTHSDCPAENAAIKSGVQPREWTLKNIATMRRQLKTMGAMWDWDAEVITCEPDYYRWNQWLFLQLPGARDWPTARCAPVDWCPERPACWPASRCIGPGRLCWRCGAPVIKRDLEQWFFRITNYADELLDFYDVICLARADQGPMQINWIGRGRRGRGRFTSARPTTTPAATQIRVFTTRPDTVCSARHSWSSRPSIHWSSQLAAPEQRAAVEAYVEPPPRARRRSTGMSTDREKTGVAAGHLTRSTRSTASASPSGSPTTCWPATARGAIMARARPRRA